jgi:hypothetical protein
LNYDDSALDHSAGALRRMSNKGTNDPNDDSGGINVPQPKISTITNKKRRVSAKKTTSNSKKKAKK